MNGALATERTSEANSALTRKAEASDARREALSPPARRPVAPFVVCAACLAIAAGLLQYQKLTGRHFHKEAVPLRKPLSAMDKERLLPEYKLHVEPPPPISEETIESLGTNEFLTWRLVDTARDLTDPACVAHLFVTYYTGQPDQVPHVPDECYRAGGYDQKRAFNTDITAAGIGASGDKLPVRVLAFESPRQNGRLLSSGAAPTNIIVYFFLTNGKYAITRDEVRFVQADPFDRYAYYAKIEVNFTDYSFRQLADEKQSLAATERLMRKVMPVLLEEHFADWKALNAGGPAAATDKQ